MTEFKNLKFYSVKVEKGNNDFELEYTWEFVIDNQNNSIKYINNLKTKLRKIFFYQYLMKEEYFYDNNYTNEFYIKGHNYKIVHENVFPSLYIDFKYINPLDFLVEKKDYENPFHNPNLCNYNNNNCNNYNNNNKIIIILIVVVVVMVVFLIIIIMILMIIIIFVILIITMKII